MEIYKNLLVPSIKSGQVHWLEVGKNIIELKLCFMSMKLSHLTFTLSLFRVN